MLGSSRITCAIDCLYEMWSDDRRGGKVQRSSFSKTSLLEMKLKQNKLRLLISLRLTRSSERNSGIRSKSDPILTFPCWEFLTRDITSWSHNNNKESHTIHAVSIRWAMWGVAEDSAVGITWGAAVRVQPYEYEQSERWHLLVFGSSWSEASMSTRDV